VADKENEGGNQDLIQLNFPAVSSGNLDETVTAIRGSSALLVQQGFTAESKESIELGLRTAMVAARVFQIINSAASEGAENHGLRKLR
jgi:primosomal replication protein N